MRSAPPCPVEVLTSIEGVHTEELKDRCVTVKYFIDEKLIKQEGRRKLKRTKVEREIVDARDEMMSAIVIVISEYLKTRQDLTAQRIAGGVNPIDRFSEHFEELCYLLVAFGRVMYGMEAGDAWATQIIDVWDAVIMEAREEGGADVSASPLEAPILEWISKASSKPYTWEGRPGKLYLAFPKFLLLELQRNPALMRDLPKEPGQLVNRLRSSAFEGFVFLDKNSQDSTVPGAKRLGEKDCILYRRTKGQPVGIFVPDDLPEHTASAEPEPAEEDVPVPIG